MKVYLLLFLYGFLSIFTHVVKTAPQEDKKKLKLVIEFFRHGARAPIYNNLDGAQWPSDIPQGYLTPKGQRQHYIIGKQIKKNYKKELSIFKNFRPDAIQVYSTYVQRAITSAQSQLYGMFENTYQRIDKRSFNETLDLPPLNLTNLEKIKKRLRGRAFPEPFQPIAIFSGDVNDKLMLPNNHCPSLKRIIKENYQSELYLSLEDSLKKEGFYANYSKVFNITDPNLLNVEKMQEVLDTVNCDIYQGRDTPKELTPSLLSWMNFAYSFRQIYLQKGNESVIKYFASPPVEFILNKLNNAVNGTDNITQLILLAAHDDSLINVLLALGVISYTDDYNEFSSPKRFHFLAF
jgi:hypothetical protein